jgi:hypothetical protein
MEARGVRAIPREIPQEEFLAAKEELERVRTAWLRQPGVRAVDVGYKLRDGRPTDELAIRVHIEQKLPPSSLPPDERLPERLGAFPVDVIEATYGLEGEHA